jgi:hypothetical protein
MKHRGPFGWKEHPLHHAHRGTFSPVFAPPKRTDFSSSGDIHREVVAGERPTRAKWRHMMRIAKRGQVKTMKGVNP